MSVRFGAFVPQGWRMDLADIDDPVEQYEAMTRVARAAEAAGYDSIWVYDHMHTTPTPEVETCFEAWTITAGLVRDTTRVRVGQMVTCNGYRNPALLAKMASTVDVMSHGRLICGLGAGWYEHEWRAYGYGFPETRDRMRAFREAVQIVTRMWTDTFASFEGDYYRIDGAINEPKAAQSRPPTLWLGGGGEKVTLKLVAQYAQGCNVGGGKPDVVRHKLDVLRAHCEAVGRDYNGITRSTSLNLVLLDDGADAEQATAAIRGSKSLEEYRRDAFVGTVAEVSERIEQLSEAGADYVILYFPRVAYDHTMLERFAAEVMPRFRA